MYRILKILCKIRGAGIVADPQIYIRTANAKFRSYYPLMILWPWGYNPSVGRFVLCTLRPLLGLIRRLSQWHYRDACNRSAMWFSSSPCYAAIRVKVVVSRLPRLPILRLVELKVYQYYSIRTLVNFESFDTRVLNLTLLKIQYNLEIKFDFNVKVSKIII